MPAHTRDLSPTGSQIRAVQQLLPALVADRRIEHRPRDLDAGLVRAHGLAPLAYRCGLAEFKSSYLANALAAEARADALREAAGRLADDGIPVLLLKGIAYAHGLYADPAERPMGDLDLLVPADQHARAIRCLETIGYAHRDDAAQRLPVHHAITLTRPDCAIDLHRSMVQPLRASVDLASLWGRARPVDGLAALRPDPVDETLLHLAHVGRHELFVPAISYVDGVRLLDRLRLGGRLDELLPRAHAFRLSRLVGVAMEMTTALGHGRDRLELSAPWRAILPGPREVLAGRLPARPLQIARKLALTEGPRELLGLTLTFALDQAERIRSG